MKRLLHVLRVLICLLFYQISFAQELVKGRISDDKGNGIEGVNVVQQKTDNGVFTDANGNFTIRLRPEGGKTLELSSVGFTTMVVPYTGAAINVVLQSASAAMEEVVVVGYTSQRRTSITGAIATVNIGDIEERRVPDVAQALQGQVAGVQVTQSTGAPGDQINIRIRGEGTIGNNSPLFIIDGIPSRDISFLSPAIQTMTCSLCYSYTDKR